MLNARHIARLERAARPRPAAIAFAGGLDQVTPPLQLASGFVRSTQNYECDVNGGYTRIAGYERFDGRTSPSSGTYSIIDITLTGTIAVGNTVTGATSAATGVVVASESTYIAVTKVSGTFVSGETLNVSGVGQATTTSAAVANGASSVLLHAQYKNLAADQYRADIAAPTGSGSSLGGVRLGGVTYTFRANAGGTAVNLWKSTTSGWSQITLFNEVSFTAGAVSEPADGETLTQGAVTATVKRTVVTSGSFSGGDAAGKLIVGTPAGGNLAAGAATLSGSGTCTLAGAQAAISFATGGRFEFVVENFGGSTSTKRIYGCDGANRGFEFDGTVLVPIDTGMAADTPDHVHVHAKHLFFSYGASVQHSGPGEPFVWSAALGASEFGVGDDVSGFQSQAGSQAVGTLAIFTRNRTYVLYGTGVSDWQLVAYKEELGAYPYTIQNAGQTMFLDDRGVTNFRTAQAYGNFSHATLSARVRTWLNGERTKAVASCVVRDKDQYRLFFSDGYVLYVTLKGNGVAGMMPVLLPNAATWVYSSEESDGSETIYFGSTDGKVYQMEKGTSFDGAAITHYLYLAWDFLSSPRTIKRFYDCTLEVSGSGYASLNFSYELGYSSTDVVQQTAPTAFAIGSWDSPSAVWDTGVWDGQTLMPSSFNMDGEAENLSLVVSGSSDYEESFKLSGAVIHYAPRREKRA